MKAKYKHFPEGQLLMETFYGDIALDDLHQINQHQSNHIDFRHVKKTFSDIRKAKISLSVDELNNYIEDLKNMLKIQQFRWAIVTDHPQSTALSLLIKNDPFFDNKVRVFSTVTAALIFLGIEVHTQDILNNNYHIVD